MSLIPLQETTEKHPLKLAIFPVSLRVLEDIFYLPEGYRFVSASYDEYSRTLKFLVTGDDLPEVKEEGGLSNALPTLDMYYSVEWPSPELRDYRKITARAEVR